MKVLRPNNLKSSAMLGDNLLPVGLGHRYTPHKHICQWDHVLLSNMVSPPITLLLKIPHLV